ncbi:hypothetical protein GW17_00050067 [Ensete ventricosum]|nr:hypothetical protein GW17_00050067 [Ensete ventricosum]
MGFSGTRLLFMLLFPLFSFVVPYGKGREWQGEVAGEPNTEDLGAVPVSWGAATATATTRKRRRRMPPEGCISVARLF